MQPWETLAEQAIAALRTAAGEARIALDGDPGPRAALDDAVRALVERTRAFRASGDAVAPDDAARHDAVVRVLAVGLQAVQLVARSAHVVAHSGREADDAHPGSAGRMIGGRALDAVARAAGALARGERDPEAEVAMERLAAGALPQAANRVNHLYKLARGEQEGAAP